MNRAKEKRYLGGRIRSEGGGAVLGGGQGKLLRKSTLSSRHMGGHVINLWENVYIVILNRNKVTRGTRKPVGIEGDCCYHWGNLESEPTFSFKQVTYKLWVFLHDSEGLTSQRIIMRMLWA